MAKQYNDYYTYAYLREDKTPYYIGKGRGKRIYSTSRSIKAPKDKSRIIFLKKNLTEAEAFKHEVYMIFVLGRKDLGTGILRNLTNGGEGASGAVQSEEKKRKCSEAKSGKNNSLFGVPRTEEQKKAQSEKMSGENNPNYGRTGENHPMYGVPRTEAQKKTQSEKMSGRYLGALSSCSKAIIVIQPDGTELQFGSINEAARELGVNQSNLCHYLKTGRSPIRGKFKGWQFVYENSEDF
jgi:group I intron endonuclease